MQGELKPTNGKIFDSSSESLNLGGALAVSVVLHLIFLSVASGMIPPMQTSRQMASAAPIRLSALIRPPPETSPQLDTPIPPVSTPKETPVSASPEIEKEPSDSRGARLASDPEREIWTSEPWPPGEIRIRVSIDRFGTPRRLEVVASTLPHDIEEQIVVRFYSARYFPAIENNREIDGVAEFHITLGDERPNAILKEAK